GSCLAPCGESIWPNCEPTTVAPTRASCSRHGPKFISRRCSKTVSPSQARLRKWRFVPGKLRVNKVSKCGFCCAATTLAPPVKTTTSPFVSMTRPDPGREPPSGAPAAICQQAPIANNQPVVDKTHPGCPLVFAKQESSFTAMPFFTSRRCPRQAITPESILSPRGLQGFINHGATFGRELPAQLLLLIQRAQRIEVKKLNTRFHTWAGEDSDPSLPIIMVVGVGVALATPTHRVHHKRGRIKTRSVAAHVLFNVQTRCQRSAQIFH